MRVADGPIRFNGKAWVPRHLPREAIRVREVSGVPAPERVLGWFQNAPSSPLGFRQNLLDLLLAPSAVGQCDAAEA
jgi:hypothetical protein